MKPLADARQVRCRRESRELSHLRILLVEDRALLADVMGAALEDAGYEVRRVTTPQAAAMSVRDFKPDIVVFGTNQAFERAACIRRWRRDVPELKVLEVSDEAPEASSTSRADDGLPDASLRFPFRSESLPETIRNYLAPTT